MFVGLTEIKYLCTRYPDTFFTLRRLIPIEKNALCCEARGVFLLFIWCFADNHVSLQLIMKDCVLILSGGMDSVTLLYDYQERIALAVSFNYGSNHNAREIPFARLHCERLGIEHLVIPLEFMGHYFHSSLLEGDDVIPEGHYADENMRSTVVPFRNGIMLAVATGLAESRGLQHVMMANHGGDHAIYPDCRPEFVEAFDRTAQAGTYVGVRLHSPYTNLTKADIVRRGKDLAIDYAMTWSCYQGGDCQCGRCGTCVERREAFALAGIDDTTSYAP